MNLPHHIPPPPMTQHRSWPKNHIFSDIIIIFADYALVFDVLWWRIGSPHKCRITLKMEKNASACLSWLCSQISAALKKNEPVNNSKENSRTLVSNISPRREKKLRQTVSKHSLFFSLEIHSLKTSQLWNVTMRWRAGMIIRSITTGL